MTDALTNYIKFVFSRADFTVGGIRIEGPLCLAVNILALYVFLFCWSLVWLYRDARNRDKHGVLVVIFVLLTGWPLSLLLWLWLRPPLVRPAIPLPATSLPRRTY